MKYSRLPMSDYEERVSFDYSSAFTYGQSGHDTSKYQSAFTYSDRREDATSKSNELSGNRHSSIV